MPLGRPSWFRVPAPSQCKSFKHFRNTVKVDALNPHPLIILLFSLLYLYIHPFIHNKHNELSTQS